MKLQEGLVISCIFEYGNEKGHKTIQNLLDDIENLYNYLKNHKTHGDLLPNITLKQFKQSAINGLPTK